MRWIWVWLVFLEDKGYKVDLLRSILGGLDVLRVFGVGI